MKISLVLLTLDELPGLEALFDQIPFDAVDEAFAVDGGSTDGTLEFYEARQFSAADSAVVDTISLLGADVPFHYYINILTLKSFTTGF